MPFHIDSTERTGRTKILAGTATDTPLRIDHRNLWRIRIRRVGCDHLYSSRRTVAGTVAALDSVGQGYTIRFHPYGMANLYGRFVGGRDGAYGSGRADFAAFRTFRTAVTAFVGHFRLH